MDLTAITNPGAGGVSTTPQDKTGLGKDATRAAHNRRVVLPEINSRARPIVSAKPSLS